MTEAERVDLANGYSISRVINGCWQLTPDHGGGPDSRNKTLRVFADLVDHGFTTFDCADIYAGTEELLGQFRRSLPDPENIQVHTKFVPNKGTLHQLDDQAIDAGIDRSLARLGVERLDLVQYHWWDYEIPGLERLTERLLHAQQSGKIRFLGLTNFNTQYVRQIVDSGASVISLQTQYSLLDRRPERNMTAFSVDSKIRLLPYGVLAGGFLSDKYLGVAPPTDMNRSLQKYRLVIDEVGGWEELQRLLKLLSAIANKHDVTIGTIAARWVLDQPTVAAIILGVGSRSRAKQNSALADLRLDEEDREKIAAQLETQLIPPGDMYDLERDGTGPHTKIIKTGLQRADVAQ